MFETIFEDETLLVIDKPAGLRVDEDPEGGPSVQTSLNFPVERNGIVHRLDKDTSGLLIIAKTQPALENLKEQFQNHTTKKIYTTLVSGSASSQEEIRSLPRSWPVG